MMDFILDILDGLIAFLTELMKALGFNFATENNNENPEFVAADNEATNVLEN